MAFLSATMRSLVTYENTDVWLTLDGGERLRRRVLMAAVGNGRFFGGGMKICPAAKLDSGALDLVVVGDFTRMDVVTKIARVFSGNHLTLDEVSSATCAPPRGRAGRADAGFRSSSTARRPDACRRRFEVLPARCASASGTGADRTPPTLPRRSARSADPGIPSRCRSR